MYTYMYIPGKNQHICRAIWCLVLRCHRLPRSSAVRDALLLAWTVCVLSGLCRVPFDRMTIELRPAPLSCATAALRPFRWLMVSVLRGRACIYFVLQVPAE